ncbi:hypothetical protein [Roseibium sp. M-1]
MGGKFFSQLRVLQLVCIGIPAVIFLVSLVVLADMHGGSLFRVPIHEAGELTLFQTLFYFDHAARELPIDVILAIAIGASAATVFPCRDGSKPQFLWVAAAATCALIMVGTWITAGNDGIVQAFDQSGTRPGAEPVIGAHWYYHFLSRSALLLSVVGVGLAFSGREIQARSRGRTWIIGVTAVYAVISILFGLLQPHLIVAAFTDPVFLGHQARELATHALTSVPLGIFACAVLANPQGIYPPRSPAVWGGVALVGLAVALGLYVVAGAWLMGAGELGQSDDMRILIFPHFLEHALGYLCFLTLAPAVFLTASATRM